MCVRARVCVCVAFVHVSVFGVCICICVHVWGGMVGWLGVGGFKDQAVDLLV